MFDDCLFVLAVQAFVLAAMFWPRRFDVDGGTTAPGVLPDRATGHWQGKALIEGNMRRTHVLAARFCPRRFDVGV